jgi:hypothetical protein
MKKCLLAISLILSMATLGLATTAQQSSASTDSTQKAKKTVSGEVASVDSAKNELVVKDDTGAEIRLMIDKSTKVTKEGKPIKIAEVQPAEKVVCDAEETANGWLAKSIQVSAVKTGL